MSPRKLSQLITLVVCLFILTACTTPVPTTSPTAEPSPTLKIVNLPTMNNLIPQPVSVTPAGGVFTLPTATRITIQPDSPEIRDIGKYLADRLSPSIGSEILALPAGEDPVLGSISLTLSNDPALGKEGYELTITPEGVTLTANRAAGLFWGVQTLRQLLPPAIESATLQPGPWTITTGTIRDYPRFVWRGVMLDVARHFFTVEDVKHYMDLVAAYKINRFHLHLTDDQGWRIMINSWPDLATFGGSKEVGGGLGGYYTQAEYADLVAYAQSRYMIVIPEVDMPGHTNAALASYPELNCNGEAPKLYTGIKVGFSSLCVEKGITYEFLDEVIGEIATLTPGPYFHIGGDEAASTAPDDYKRFIELVQEIVAAHGKQIIGWEEIAQAALLPGAIVQHWNSDLARKAVEQGAQVILSPASKAYLDMQYDDSTPLGLNWAGETDIRDAYSWDPSTQIAGVAETNILGLEAPLWSETLETIKDIEFMAFPRLPGYAEIGWSPAEGRSWEEYRLRLAAHGPRFTAMEVNFYPSLQIPWE